jgi:PST family polysaccharide transporter
MSQRVAPPFAVSVGWQSVNVIVQVVLQLVFISILARILSPADFGVMAIALVVVGFVEIFAQVGIGPALVQRLNLEDSHIRSAFSFSSILGVVFFFVMYLAAPAIGTFYEDPLLTDVLRWIALSFILSGLAIVPRSLLIRSMGFKKLFAASFIAMVLANLLLGLGLAFSGYGIWSYVSALLAQNALLTILYWCFNPVRIGMTFDTIALRQMLGYGGRSTLFNVSNYAASKVDTLLIGHWAQSGTEVNGWTETGVYDRSAYLLGLPITVLGKLGDSVLFSGLSSLQKEPRALLQVIERASMLIAWLIFPVSAILVWFATDVAVLFLGPQYLQAGPVVQVLFLGVAMRSLIKLGDAVVRALDSLVSAMVIKLAFLASIVGTSWFALSQGYGIIGVAWGVTLSTGLQFIAMSVLVLQIANWSPLPALRSLKAGVIGLILTTVGCLCVEACTVNFFSDHSGSLWHFSRVGLASIWGVTCMLWVAQKKMNAGIGKPLDWISARSAFNAEASTPSDDKL